MDIVKLAFKLANAVCSVLWRARGFYYAIVLMPHECPDCGGNHPGGCVTDTPARQASLPMEGGIE